jgi:TRAP-type C4-dicarboxylate transport system permease small subunit
VLRGLERVDEVVCVAFLSFMVICIALAVVTRYVLQAPLPWPEEAAKFAFVWLTFFGAALAVKRNGHMAVDCLMPLLPASVERVLRLVMQVASICLLCLLIRYGWNIMEMSWVAISPSLSLPIGYVYLAVPVGGTLMVIRLALQVWLGLRGRSPEGAA